jgi:hypothetical protein
MFELKKEKILLGELEKYYNHTMNNIETTECMGVLSPNEKVNISFK